MREQTIEREIEVKEALESIKWKASKQMKEAETEENVSNGNIAQMINTIVQS